MEKIKPLLFVVMPFGRKVDPTGTHEINFDRVYELAIKPAAQAANLDVIRADEERSGSIIHVPMFERLLLSEIVVADLTIHNANVFYELGVRHAARPRSTILIYAKYPKEGQLPFDVNMLRALPYYLENGELTEEEGARLLAELEAKFKVVLSDLESKDSPLFQLVQRYPGINLPPEVTEAFRDRAYHIEGVRKRLAQATQLGETSLREIRRIEQELGEFNEAHAELFIELLLSYRDIKAWDDMITLVERLPRGPLASTVAVREAYAFALNRRNGGGDRRKAITVLHEVVDEHGLSAETCGIMGRIFKDLYDEAAQQGDQDLAAGYLDEAIDCYRRGFEADPRDYYPGINAATLLFVKGGEEATQELTMLAAAVAFAVTRRGGLKSHNYWDVATLLEAAALREDWPTAGRALSRLLMLEAAAWAYETTARNLTLIRDTRAARGLVFNELDTIIERLLKAAS